MDRCGEYLSCASRIGKHRYGEYAKAAVEETPGVFPDERRWVARLRVRGETMGEGYGPTPEYAARLLAEDLAEPVSRRHAGDRAVLDDVAHAGIG